jgi:cytochrome P450
VIDRRVARMIADRRATNDERDDLLSRLLRARDESGGSMSDRQLRDEIVTLFVAGHETTATGLAWSLYLLARHPAIYDAIEREALAYDDRPIGRTGLPELPLALAVFSEALRMYPPVPIFERQALEPVEIGGHRLAVGGYVGVFPWALHHRAALWPDPDRFDPDRFAPGAETGRPRHAHLPFGAGPRVCLGAHFAMLEGALVLSTVLRRARLELADAREVVPDPRAATTRPLGGVRMRVHRHAR